MVEEFNALFNKIADSECHIWAEEYVDFDIETCSSLLVINSNKINWRVSSVSLCDRISYKRMWLNEVASNNDDNKDDDDSLLFVRSDPDVFHLPWLPQIWV